VKAELFPRAEADIIHQFRYYLVDQDAPVIAVRFHEAVIDCWPSILAGEGIRHDSHLLPRRSEQPACRQSSAWQAGRSTDIEAREVALRLPLKAFTSRWMRPGRKAIIASSVGISLGIALQ
jgi:plasmid stabilization system protein ParE